jgi:hypothetical protein
MVVGQIGMEAADQLHDDVERLVHAVAGVQDAAGQRAGETLEGIGHDLDDPWFSM